MIKIDSSFDAFVLTPSNFVLRYTHDTIFAEKKSVFTWLKAHTFWTGEYKLRKIIDTLRNQPQQPHVVIHLNRAVDRYNKLHQKTPIERIAIATGVMPPPAPPAQAENEEIEFVEDYVMKFLEPYLAGEIGPENEDTSRAPLIEKLYPEFCKKFPRSKASRSDIQQASLGAYFQEVAKSLVRIEVLSENDLKEPYIEGLPDNWSRKQEKLVSIYPAIQHALQIDFKGISLSVKEMQDHLKKALKTVFIHSERAPFSRPLGMHTLSRVSSSVADQTHPVNVSIYNATQEAIVVSIRLDKTAGELKRAIAEKLGMVPEDIAILMNQGAPREYLLADDVPLNSLDLKKLLDTEHKALKWVKLPKERLVEIGSVRRLAPAESSTATEVLIDKLLTNSQTLSAAQLREKASTFNRVHHDQLFAHAHAIGKTDVLQQKFFISFRAIFPDSPDLLHKRLAQQFAEEIQHALGDSHTREQAHTLARLALNEYVRVEMERPLKS